MIEETRINSFGQLHEAVMSYGRKITAYRGVKDCSYGLLPKVGRLKFINKIALEKEEKIIITRFKQHALPYINIACHSMWDWLALAQHQVYSHRYGITRASMFPGLDGLASQIQWLRAEQY